MDFEGLRARVRARADALRSKKGAPRADATATQSLLPDYRAADAYLDRVENLNFPLTRIPGKLAALRRFGPVPRFLLRVYNYAFRKTREATTAQALALRELTRAGGATARRLSEVESELARLRDMLEGRSEDKS